MSHIARLVAQSGGPILANWPEFKTKLLLISVPSASSALKPIGAFSRRQGYG